MADKKDPREQRLADTRKATDKQNTEAFAKTENVQPTPTQEENDRAALGIASLSELDDKEADGSEEEAPANPRKG